MAAYLYLEKGTDVRAVKTERATPGLIVDYNEKGKPVGLEIVSQMKVNTSQINKVLRSLSISTVSDTELAPLKVVQHGAHSLYGMHMRRIKAMYSRE